MTTLGRNQGNITKISIACEKICQRIPAPRQLATTGTGLNSPIAVQLVFSGANVSLKASADLDIIAKIVVSHCMINY
jgi:hypothetical protein